MSVGKYHSVDLDIVQLFVGLLIYHVSSKSLIYTDLLWLENMWHYSSVFYNILH